METKQTKHTFSYNVPEGSGRALYGMDVNGNVVREPIPPTATPDEVNEQTTRFIGRMRTLVSEVPYRVLPHRGNIKSGDYIVVDEDGYAVPIQDGQRPQGTVWNVLNPYEARII